MPYRSQLGGVLYLNVCSRPDISFAVSTLASHCQDPKICHWHALQELIRYLDHTQDVGITYGKRTDNMQSNQLYVYADADFASQKSTARSRSGYVIYLNGGPVAWNSSYQSTVALSTSEAELYALSEAAKATMDIRELLNDLGFPQMQTTIHEDNKGCKEWIQKQGNASKMRHIETRHHWIKEKRDIFNIIHVATEFQRADIFTKAMDPKQFIQQCNLLYGDYLVS